MSLLGSQNGVSACLSSLLELAHFSLLNVLLFKLILNVYNDADNQSYTEADNVNNITDANQFYSVTPEAFEEWLATEDKAVSADAGTNRDEGK